MFAIGAWTMCTAALSVLGISKAADFRSGLMSSTVREPAQVAASASPSVSPSRAPRVLTTPGGSVVARCDSGLVWVDWLSPATGFRVEDATHGPAPESRVTFKADSKLVRVVVRCAADGPHAEVTPG
ncbi:hypothetical protein GCM10010399_41900 [Dactylosporangium fulvum]|uniref:Secreted protein n=1 Tax=Dactylosporangium fulvum TaxID=53359 RepID=A0ABY5VWK0_9ACTN|nr:hypothetical protein [Dactylosporangium fulvum]UWP81627.1 hypothetical protein Dfulv_42015 [Dactylosporangium fulvum]